jgi:signal transduction histidine kinase
MTSPKLGQTVKLAAQRVGTRIASINPSPLLKQVPTVILCLIAAVLEIASPSVKITVLSAVIGSGIGIVIATVLAWAMTLNRRWEPFLLLVPAIDVIATVALQYGTNGLDSVFAAVTIIPLLWFTVESGRRHLLLGIVGALLSLYAGYLLFNGRGELPDATEFARDRFTFAVISTVAGVAIFSLMREARRRLDNVELMLAESRAHAEMLSRSEARVSAAEGLLRGLWQAITAQSAIGTDVTGLVDAWNPGAAKMFGLPVDEVVGVRHVDDFHVKSELLDRSSELGNPEGTSEQSAGFAALVEAARLGDADVREWNYLRDDGGQIPVELSVTARLDDVGATVGYLFVAVDLRKAKEVSRLKDEFVGLISHELRTPLSSVLGYLELLRDEGDVPLSEEQLGYLDVAERNANRLLRLVGDLLFTAQVESGKFHLDEQAQQLAPILMASVESARPIAAAAGIELGLDLAEDCMVNADGVRLGQGCDNLISNAIKFTPRGGRVTVGLRGSASSAVITVADTGMGIAAEELDQLFSRFFRATTATRNAVQGVGLGLVITRAIARAHGGEIGVASEEGVGTTFSMTLPLLEPQWLSLPITTGARP